MSAAIIPFNPLDKTNLGASVADALLARPVVPLEDLAEFHGAGVYALYYKGKFKPYSILATPNANGQHTPIYVGKAVPAGARAGTYYIPVARGPRTVRSARKAPRTSSAMSLPF